MIARAVAILVATLATGCTVALRPPDAPGPAAVTSTTRRAVALRTSLTRASANYQFDLRDGADPIRSAAPQVLTANLPERSDATVSTFVLVFPLARVPVSCLRRVELQLRVLGGRGAERGTLAVYAAKALSLASGRLGNVQGVDAYVAVRPRGIAEVPRDSAWASIDVTDLYKLWARGGPFPNGETVPQKTPLVVEVRPPSYAATSGGPGSPFVRHFAAITAGPPSAPRLRLTALRDC